MKFQKHRYESDKTDGAKLSALRNTTGVDLPSSVNRVILDMLMSVCKEVGNPRDDLTPQIKITQLSDCKSMVDTVESLGGACHYQRTNCIRFISTFVEHIKNFNQIVCS